MRRLRLLSAPPAIAIDDEPLGVDHGDWPPGSEVGFEFVPAWHARPARGRRRGLATLPALAVAVAVALSVGPSHDATPVRAGAGAPAAPTRAALVVRASPPPTSDVAGARW
jgi:hypothetical protein